MAGRVCSRDLVSTSIGTLSVKVPGYVIDEAKGDRIVLALRSQFSDRYIWEKESALTFFGAGQ